MLTHIVEELGWMFNGTRLGRRLWTIEEWLRGHEEVYWKKGKRK